MAEPCDIVLMGDSQMNAALMQVDAVANRKKLDVLTDREATTLEHVLKKRTELSLKVVNLALAGAMVSDQYLISKALFALNPPKLVIIGISPRSFIDNAMPAASATEPFHFFQRYVSLNSLVAHSFPDLLTQANWFLQEYFPLKQLYDPIMLAFRKMAVYAPWLDSTDKAIRQTGTRKIPCNQKPAETIEGNSARLLQAIGGGTDEPAKGENVIYPVSLYGFIDNTREYQRRYRDSSSPNYKNQCTFFKEYLHLLKSLGSQVIVLGMPVLIANRQLLPEKFWHDYRRQIGQECASYGAIWVDLSQDDSFDKRDFLDNVHLNGTGGHLLMGRIGGLISNNASLLQILQPGKLVSAKP